MSERLASFHSCACACLALASGCGGSAGLELGDARAAAYVAMHEAVDAFKARRYADAEPKLTAAIDSGLLNPDVWCEAVAKRAVCWGAAGRYDEALAELDKLGPAASNQDEIFAARAYIYAKQGKAADARLALGKARQFNRAVQEFKD